MNLRRVRAVARKEFIHIFRDPRSLGMGIAIPMLLLFLFGYALTLDVDRVPLAVWDQSGTVTSRELVSRFSGSRYFALAGQVSDYQALERAVDRRDALVGLVVPPEFAGSLAAGRPAAVQLILDGSDSTTATIAAGYAEAVVWGFNDDLLRLQIRRRGLEPPDPPLDLRPRVWYNADLLSRNAIVPGIIAVIMMVIAALLTSLTVAREWENGTMEQLLSTPVRGAELFVGKLIPYVAIGILDLLLAVLVGKFVFLVPIRGSLWLLFGVALLFIVGALSFGMLLSIVTRNQLLASQLALVTTMLPAFLLSGFIFPIENMPPPIRAITHIITARYLVSMLRGIYLKEADLAILAGDILFLAGFAVVVITLAIRKFRTRID